MDYPIEVHGLQKAFYLASRRRKGLLEGMVNYLSADQKKLVVLDSLDVKIAKGEIYCLLGPNGTGKTTLIKILSTTMLPDGGRALINGLDVTKPSNKDRISASLGIILGERSRSFYWRLTARQNLDFYADLYELGEKEKKERVEYLLDFVGLVDRKDDQISRFSSGMLNRLAIARAFLHSPDILLLDEFLTNLDPRASADIREVIRNLARKESKTVLITSNNSQEAESLGDRVGILHNGRLVAEGSPDELKRRFGGKESAIRLSFEKKPSESLLARLRKAGMNPRIDRNAILLRTTDPRGCLDDSLRSMKDADIRGIEISPPSLETVFINVTRENGPHA